MSGMRLIQQHLKRHPVWYIVGVIILSFALGFFTGQAAVTRSDGVIDRMGKDSMISEQEAIERAKERLTELNRSFEGREVKVSRQDTTYKVVFPPPKLTLGGDFTVIVDANTGKVLNVTIER
jgi:uncharacterized membrane protein YkoI